MTKAKLALTVAAATIALVLGSASARADNVDFFCSLGASSLCTGTVVQSGANYSTTGIQVFNDSGPYSASDPFTLVFNTATGAISITDADETSQTLIGDITTFAALTGNSTKSVSFVADWPTLPSAVQTKLGSPTGEDIGFVIYLSSNNKPTSIDVTITPTPEPASLLLLGSGLVGIGGFLRRKLIAET